MTALTDRARYIAIGLIAAVAIAWMVWANAEQDRCEERGGRAIYDRTYQVKCAAEPEGDR